MIIQETPLHIAKLRCVTEAKQLRLYEDQIITQEVIDLIMYEAEKHERIHPKHEVEVLIYNKAPEEVSIESEKKD